ncbi:Inner membrane component of TAM transport system [hydrothermal vent metagenome]|uniref:Inner membrane component of TAM transport system n=1 Tax=hydrothermal vent metagenome TaxID=652676 RepID=A0A3B0SNJ9_9ZZZZ
MSKSMSNEGDNGAFPVKRRLLSRTFLTFLGTILLLIVVGVVGAAFWLDSDSGHAFIISQVEALEPEDGLKVDIGDIEGSIYGETRILDLELSDPKGRFFQSGTIALDWNPLAWIFGELYISVADISKARLERLPELIAAAQDQPLLPEFDIYIGSFRADNLMLGKAVTGEEQFADLAGAIDVRAGRAMVNLDAKTTRSGDKLVILLNAEPEAQKLDLDVDIIAPAGGVIGRYLGLVEDSTIALNGEGDWKKWDGDLVAASAGQQVASFKLTAHDGLFGYDGDVTDDLLPSGIARRLGAPRLAIRGESTFEGGRAGIDLIARSPAIAMTVKGGVDLSTNALDAMRVEAQVREPSTLLTNMKAQDLKLKALLNGRFSELRYQYLLTAPQLAFGKTLLMGVRVEGNGSRDTDGFDIPVKLAVGNVIGNGELAQRLASGLKGSAILRLDDDQLTSQNAVFATQALTGKMDASADLSGGDYAILIDAQAPGFFINGIGLIDIIADMKISPGESGVRLTGDATAQLKRFDNAFLRELGGGLPRLETGLALGPDGLFRFSDLSIAAPKLTFNGSGVQKTGAIFAFTGRGRHDQYGAFNIDLDGALNRPQIALLLDDPLPAAGLSGVRVNLKPVDSGFLYTATGGSTLGPFDSTGAIVAGRERDTLVRVDRLLISKTLATGVIRPTSAGLAGKLDISGGGVTGDILFEPGNNRQLIRTDLMAKNARFDGNPSIFIRTGKLDADVVLIQGRSNIKATVRAQGISRGDLVIGRIAGNANLVNGAGNATFSVAGTRGSTFEFQAKADVQPDHYLVSGNGNFHGRTLRLSRPLDLRRVDGGWTVAPTTLRYGNGSARFSGRLASGTSRLNMSLSRMPLSVADIVFDDLGLGGLANGTIKLTQSGSSTPVGEAKLNIKGLTRSGLILTSTPVDMGLNMAISSRNAAARGIIKSQAGKTIGRFQGRVTGLGGGNWKNQLLHNPLFAQARFNGTADSLWRLTGVEAFDLTGPLAVSADIGGTFAKPQIRGQLVATNARLESGLTGTVISNIKARGTFNGSRLVLPDISGSTKGGGTVSGSGSFNFAVESGVGVGITLTVLAKNAALIARDDFAATVSGPIKIRNSSAGGLISGDVVLNRSYFKFGRASETVALPQIKVREINRRADERPARVRTRPWRFALSADVPNRLQVEGLGLDSEWRANLKLTGPVDNFSMTGNANLLRGNYTFAGRRFRLERGRIRFVGNQPPNPVLDIEAEANLRGLNATINVKGTGNRPEIAFNSIPALPQDELLSRVLFGDSIANLSAPEAVQLAAAVASLNSGGGLDPINQLRKAAGLDRLRILPSNTDSGTGTSIAAGKYITRRAYVELITDGKGYSATRLEFQITRWLSILSSISTLGRQSANVRVSKDY